jgi:omega-6 fatty acid desaturase (delta-12 desaturase)
MTSVNTAPAPDNAGVDIEHVARTEWYHRLGRYERPSTAKATLQILDTFGPYIGLWALMIVMLKHHVSYLFVLPLTVLAALFAVRIFIIFHDCGHGSYFESHRANKILGYISGILVFTPFEQWRKPHAVHHATVGDLDRRGDGDIWTMTVDEYKSVDIKTKLSYRLYRNPLLMFIVGPPFLFTVLARFPHPDAGKLERQSVLITNAAIAAIMVAAAFTIGLKAYFMIQIPIIFLAADIGTWLFYVQHQFEDVYWERHGAWDPITAALVGSSFYRLPKWLQWFSGNIGLHHIHHLKPRIANYNLQQCHDEMPELQTLHPISLKQSLATLKLKLLDEKAQKMVGYEAAL